MDFAKLEREHEARSVVHAAMRKTKADIMNTYPGRFTLRILPDPLLPEDLRRWPVVEGS